eukprot:TRINITY_DN44211_c0_g1_i1.p1 TRINITY_DN44211_c0_g1~~TRINITY_DN44211_c0_g1_i1.p1  ORF type:complete len:293 (+),score=71.29 TRINITY_DN44211_c0_g1_i1:55-933(+)
MLRTSAMHLLRGLRAHQAPRGLLRRKAPTGRCFSGRSDIPQPVMPSLHLPTYFELREVGINYRYRSDPEWVVDVIQRDCVREEGLTFVNEASTYATTFFQLINYCARRGYQVVSYGSEGRRRYAVLYNAQVDVMTRKGAPPPTQHLAAREQQPEQQQQQPRSHVDTVNDAVRDGKMVRWDGQPVRTERKMKREDFVFYDKDAPGGIGSFAREPAEAVLVDPAEVQMQMHMQPGSVLMGGEVPGDTTVAEATANVADALKGDAGARRRRSTAAFIRDDLTMAIPPDEQAGRGL